MKKKIAVIFGGRSAEHDVSIITAYNPIISSLVATGRYDLYPIYIAKNDSWYSNNKMTGIEFFQKDDYETHLGKKLMISFDEGLKIIWPAVKRRTVKIDLVFPAMHGTFGEDGSLMGLLRMANVPFVGCDLFASAVAMDKVLTKQILAIEGIKTVPYIWFMKEDWDKKRDYGMEKASQLKWPLFVKPVHLGSSIAISKVKDVSELERAIDVAFHYDDKVLVEESIENLIEVTLPIMGNENPKTANIERALNKTEFFDFTDKYLSGGKGKKEKSGNQTEIPAKIDEVLSQKVKDIGVKTYQILGCSGIARVDFLIDGLSGEVFVNEVNTLPGSLYHHNWKKAGLSPIDLVTGLMDLAEERFNSKKDITYNFKSEILKSALGPKGNKIS